LLSSRGISTPSLQARGEQRRFFYFNNDRDIPVGLGEASSHGASLPFTQRHEILFRLCHRGRLGPITRALGIMPGALSE
jgi:hypothetical protein